MSNYYATVAASQTGAVLTSAGGVGEKGDRLDRVIVNVATSATGTVTIIDGSTSISLTSANIPIGTYQFDLGIASKTGAWTVTTGAGASIIAIGDFGILG